MASKPHAKRLQRVAAPLAPQAPPFYVAAATPRHRAVGWYWLPTDAAAPVFLGHNHVIAELALYELTARGQRLSLV